MAWVTGGSDSPEPVVAGATESSGNPDVGCGLLASATASDGIGSAGMAVLVAKERKPTDSTVGRMRTETLGKENTPGANRSASCADATTSNESSGSALTGGREAARRSEDAATTGAMAGSPLTVEMTGAMIGEKSSGSPVGAAAVDVNMVAGTKFADRLRTLIDGVKEIPAAGVRRDPEASVRRFPKSSRAPVSLAGTLSGAGAIGVAIEVSGVANAAAGLVPAIAEFVDGSWGAASASSSVFSAVAAPGKTAGETTRPATAFGSDNTGRALRAGATSEAFSGIPGLATAIGSTATDTSGLPGSAGAATVGVETANAGWR